MSAQAGWEQAQWDETTTGSIITHAHFEDLRKRIFLMMYPLAGYYELDTDDVMPVNIGEIPFNGEATFNEPGKVRWKLRHYGHQRHPRGVEFWLNSTLIEEDAPGQGYNYTWPPFDINPDINYWDIEHNIGLGHLFVLTPNYNRYHDYDKNGTRKLVFHEAGDEDTPWADHEETWEGGAFCFLPQQTDGKEVNRTVQFLSATGAWKYKYDIREKTPFKRGTVYEPKSSGPIMSSLYFAYLKTPTVMARWWLYDNQYGFGTYLNNRPGESFKQRNVKLEQYADSKFSGSVDTNEAAYMNVAELILCDPKFGCNYDSEYTTNWEIEYSPDTYDNTHANFDRFPHVNDDLWGEHKSGFELALKKSGYYDWYFDVTYPYIPDSEVKLYLQGNPLTVAFPIGTWRRTWKYTMGRINPFYKAFETGDPTYEFQDEPYYGGWNSDFPEWNNFYEFKYNIVAAEGLWFEVEGDLTKESNTDPVTGEDIVGQYYYEVGGQVLVFSKAEINRSSITEVTHHCVWGNITGINYRGDDETDPQDRTRIYLDKVIRLDLADNLTMDGYAGWWASYDRRLSDRHDPDYQETTSLDETTQEPEVEWVYFLRPALVLNIRRVLNAFSLVDVSGEIDTEHRDGNSTDSISDAMDDYYASNWSNGTTDVGVYMVVRPFFNETYNYYAQRIKPVSTSYDLPNGMQVWVKAHCRDVYYDPLLVPPAGEFYYFTQSSGHLISYLITSDPADVETHYDFMEAEVDGRWLYFYPEILWPWRWADPGHAAGWFGGIARLDNLAFVLDGSDATMVADIDWLTLPPDTVWERDFTSSYQTTKDLSEPDTEPPQPDPAVWVTDPEFVFVVIDNEVDASGNHMKYEYFELVLRVKLVLHEDETPPIQYQILQDGEEVFGWHITREFDNLLRSYAIQDVFKDTQAIITSVISSSEINPLVVEVNDVSNLALGDELLILPRNLGPNAATKYWGIHTITTINSGTKQITLQNTEEDISYTGDGIPPLLQSKLYWANELSVGVQAYIDSFGEVWQVQARDSANPPNTGMPSERREAVLSSVTPWDAYDEWYRRRILQAP